MALQLPPAAGDAKDEEIQQPLTLVMPVAVDRVAKLRELLCNPEVKANSETALTKVGTVHSTRFVILEDGEQRWAKLAVIATFDGSVEAYIGAFAREMTDIFNGLLQFVDDPPSLPVQDHVQEFITYVKAHDVKPANGRTYRAYPDLTVLDIYEATRPRHDAALSVRP